MPLRNKTKEINDIFFVAAANILKNNVSEEEKKLLGPSLEDIIISCSFDDNPCNNSVDFISKFNRFLGNCYVYNSGVDSNNNPVELKNYKQPGKTNGLKLVLHNVIPHDLRAVMSDYGFTIRIDSNSSLNVHWKDGIDILNGYTTNIAVDRTFTYKMAKPYSNCDIDRKNYKNEESDLYKLFAKFNYPYKQKYCIDLCYQKLAIANCNCSDIESISFYDHVDTCHTKEKIIKCLDYQYNNFLGGDYITNHCLPLCPLECEKLDYRTTTSLTQFQNDLYTDILRENSSVSRKILNYTIGLDEVDQAIIDSYKFNLNIAKLNIYYNSLSYTEVTESESLSLVSLLSNIGGTIGLFMGISLLTAVELVEICIYYIYKAKNKVIVRQASQNSINKVIF